MANNSAATSPQLTFPIRLHVYIPLFMTQIVLKRVYDEPSASDGYRVLVDKLWPRGVSHERLPYDLWAKDLAPSDELREWFHADRVGRWDEFSKKYAAELECSPQMKQFVQSISSKPKVTLLYASHDELHNQAEVIQSVAEKMLK